MSLPGGEVKTSAEADRHPAQAEARQATPGGRQSSSTDEAKHASGYSDGKVADHSHLAITNSLKWNSCIKEFIKALADLGHAKALSKMANHDFMYNGKAPSSKFVVDCISYYTQTGLLDGAPLMDLTELANSDWGSEFLLPEVSHLDKTLYVICDSLQFLGNQS